MIILLPLLLVPEWPIYLPEKSKGLAFIQNKKMLFCKKTKIEFRDSKLQTHFF